MKKINKFVIENIKLKSEKEVKAFLSVITIVNAFNSLILNNPLLAFFFLIFEIYIVIMYKESKMEEVQYILEADQKTIEEYKSIATDKQLNALETLYKTSHKEIVKTINKNFTYEIIFNFILLILICL